MQLAATIMSALLAGLGAMGVFYPDVLLEVGRYLSTPNGLLVAAAIRILFGGLLLTAAATSRAPNLLRVFGAVILIVGLLTPVYGPERAQRTLQILAANRGEYFRIGGTFAILIGVTFVWALSPRGTPRPK
jgi:uncharacterized protein YjeT (DUF2065 family)